MVIICQILAWFELIGGIIVGFILLFTEHEELLCASCIAGSLVSFVIFISISIIIDKLKNIEKNIETIQATINPNYYTTDDNTATNQIYFWDCEHCGAQNLLNENTCKWCGYSRFADNTVQNQPTNTENCSQNISTTWTCKNCGTVMGEQDKFCIKCGSAKNN